VRVLALNVGSHTLKAKLFALDHSRAIGRPAAPIRATQHSLTDTAAVRAAQIQACIASYAGESIDVIAHRVVASLPQPLHAASQLDDEHRDAIRAAGDIAPLHTALAFAALEATDRTFPDVPQVAVYDSWFHRTLPDYAAIYGVPFDWYCAGLHRIGYYGLIHEYALHRAAELLGRAPNAMRLLSVHLGAGSSIAAIANAVCVDTTMGFTPLDGVPMLTRPGAIDPGIILYALRHGLADLESLPRILNHESGLTGISGASGEIDELVRAMLCGDARATLAFQAFCFGIARGIGSLGPASRGVDVLTFTGGIGEHSAEVRERTCASLEFLGIGLDESANKARPAEGEIGRRDAAARTLVIHAEEEWVMACHTADAAERLHLKLSVHR
jgi:acetate kinase